MELAQRLEIPMERQLVWDALNDPEVLKQCLPGCQRFEAAAEDCFEITVQAKVGPVKAVFKGDVRLTDMDPPRAYQISGQGQGGVAGFAKGSAQVALESAGTASNPATIMTYSVNATVGGKLAQVGGRLINGAARKIAQEFFRNFVGNVCNQEALDITIETIEIKEN
ncbi:MAG: carbon monoxide dehydrogenase subunit G [Gammaproteobacteria bacterium]|jgi:uncharacterized protein|nr:carbon monoxide dehydrogenase subunit G [Gammaproteobacteria bacterium]MBT5201855.1 carbon monoxide dehydrogenase subunit G [Gammaproteobacteria bacterium]MBT5602629.1 carbon monoxide dehydrogenase subunit G [Gammaproteobacteria bacterium]MBT6244203.1 carbon monoxide dehydrogenase subunit G [Gammaproteobacteria bacterium]